MKLDQINHELILNNNDIRRLACDSALKFIGIMFENVTGTQQSKNIDHLHDMRVASRKLRECFRIFSSFYVSGKPNKLLKRVKKVTRILGIPREMDVNVALLRAYKARSSPVAQTTHEYLLEIFEFEQARRRQKMLRAFDKLKLKALQSDLTHFAQTASSQSQTPHLLADMRQIDEARAFMNHATQILEKRAAAILSFQHAFSASQVNRDEEFHLLRIKVKKCRYCLEMLHPLYMNQFEKSIGLAKELQDVLGQFHDIAVLIRILNIHRVHLMETNRIHLVKGCQQIVADLGELRTQLVPRVAPTYDSFLLELGHILNVGSKSSRSSEALAEVEVHIQDSVSDIQKMRALFSARKSLDLLDHSEKGNLKGRVM